LCLIFFFLLNTMLNNICHLNIIVAAKEKIRIRQIPSDLRDLCK